MSTNEEKKSWSDAVLAHPTRWPVRCPSCARRLTVELPYGERAGRTGTRECPAGHAFSFCYDGVTVVVCGFAPASPHLRPA